MTPIKQGTARRLGLRSPPHAELKKALAEIDQKIAAAQRMLVMIPRPLFAAASGQRPPSTVYRWFTIRGEPVRLEFATGL